MSSFSGSNFAIFTVLYFFITRHLCCMRNFIFLYGVLSYALHFFFQYLRCFSFNLHSKLLFRFNYPIYLSDHAHRIDFKGLILLKFFWFLLKSILRCNHPASFGNTSHRTFRGGVNSLPQYYRFQNCCRVGVETVRWFMRMLLDAFGHIPQAFSEP